MPGPDTAADLALMESAVRDAGDIARRYYGGTFKRWDKGHGNPVTECDLEVDRFLCDRLRSARADYGWLSEEADDDRERLQSDAAFVVDPIDGTVAFMKHRPHFSISVALVRNGRPVAGVVYNPITGECATARQGAGAFSNGHAIRVSARSEIEGSRMLADKNMLTHPAWAVPPNTPWPPMHIESRNSIAYRMALVATGEFDAMLALSPKRDWDLAAADIIVCEAGGRVTTHQGATLVYNTIEALQPSVVAAGPALHIELMTKTAHLKLPRQ